MLRTTVLLAALLAGCPKPQPPEEPLPTGGGAPEAPKPEKAPVPEHVAQMARNFNKVFFAFDSSDLSADGKAALDANAAIMGEYSDIRLEIQGHADERGTTEYNLALGQKRADAVVRYLLGKGIATSRVKSVSYGEERPVDGRAVETAYDENRRAEFKITYGGDGAVQGTTN